MNADDSLDKLTKSLRNNDAYETKNFKQSKQYFLKEYPFMTDEDFKLVITKGIYPYEYMNNFEKFNETKLPDIKCFYSSLNDETVTEDQYKHAQNIWETFRIKNLGEYHDFYLKTDVMLLSDVFENYRDLDLKTYKVDPAWY